MAQSKLIGFALAALLLQVLLATPRFVGAKDDFRDSDGDGIVDDADEDKVSCLSTEASPLAEDVVEVVNYLKSLPIDQTCCQDNCWGSLCTTMSTHGTAATNICSTYEEDCGVCYNCNELATLFDRIGETCVSAVEGIPKIGGSRALLLNHKHFSVGIF